MRVIAGSARRIPLVSVRGDAVRPTQDKIKETLFNILQNDLYECRFLDLFAGSGGIGIEALSRGAGLAVLTDKNRHAIRCIQENLKKTHLEQKAVVMEGDFQYSLKRLMGQKRVFDIVFLDPPYGMGLEEDALRILSDSDLIHSGSQIILETSIKADLSYVGSLGFDIFRIKEYKTNQHVFMQRRSEA